MISVQDSLRHIDSNVINLGTESLPLTQAQGRILAEKLITDRPLPPYDRVTMDGIAINYEGFLRTNKTIRISGIAPAGAPQASLSCPEECVEVMTGAVLPIGTDSIIRYEDLDIKDGYATVNIDTVVKGKNVHTIGSDIDKNKLLLEEGCKLGPAEIGIAASIGKHQLVVKKIPRTVVLSTGDELVDIDVIPQAHQIRRSNTYTISSLLSTWGIAAEQVHLPDEKQIILDKLKMILEDYDLVVLTGGVSKGKFDFIPDALVELGVKQIFHKVKQRPGKPIWFGRKENTIVFGLPGNPVSSFVCARKYIFHWLRKSLKCHTENVLIARLASDVSFAPDLHYYLPVSLYTSADGILLADPYKGNGSGDFVNLKNINAFLELPRGKDSYKVGEAYPVLTI